MIKLTKQNDAIFDSAGNPVELFDVMKNQFRFDSGDAIFIFESSTELNEFIKITFPETFDIESFKQQITDRVQQLVDETARSLWYDSMIDVATVNIAGGRWENESKSLLKWNSDIWETVEDYFNTIVDEPEMTVDQFIQTLTIYGADN